MNWIPLIDLDEEVLFRGAVFSFPAKAPFESRVHFMLIEEPESDSGYKMICSTGFHAGQTEVFLPEEAKGDNSGISLNWLILNWTKWIYSHTAVENVLYKESYTAD